MMHDNTVPPVETPPEAVSRAQELVQRLVKDAGMTIAEISEATNGRVSKRTLYRWVKGETKPCRKNDEKVLEYLIRARCR